MRFLVHRVKSLSCAPLALALMALALGACENKHIGRPCDLGVSDDGGSSTSSTVTGQVLACPTRICLLPAKESSNQDVDTGAYCTAECSTNDDCSDGELRGSPAAGDDKRCKSGFVCGIASVLGEFCCKKLCICRDFVNTNLNGGQPATPAACLPGNGSTCHNVK